MTIAVPYFGRRGALHDGSQIHTADRHAGEPELASTESGGVIIGCLSPDGRRVGVLLTPEVAELVRQHLPQIIREARQRLRQGGRA